MTFILVPASGEDLVINGWNWRPTVALLVRAGILPAGKRAECCSAQGCGGYLSSAEALRAAEHIEGLLAAMKPDERIRFDGAITEKPIDYQKPIVEWDEAETQDRYSVRYD